MLGLERELHCSSESLFDASIDSVFRKTQILPEESANLAESSVRDIRHEHSEQNTQGEKIQSLENDNVTLLEELETVSIQLSDERNARQIQENLVDNLRREVHKLEENIKILTTDVCMTSQIKSRIFYL